MDIDKLTVKTALEKLRKKEFSSVELTKESLSRIKEFESKINAFITITEDQALRDAQRADDLISQGSYLPLLGIPYTLKDVFNTKGIKTTAGSKVLEDFIPPYDSTVYRLLSESGAVLLGKTNCDAFGHGSSTENSDFGVTRNPWDLERVAGGSSGGSAASLVYGGGLFSIAEDTGGSIRQPASFCGVTGLKPTYGLVSRYGCIAYASSLDTVGPMGLESADLEIIMKVISDKDSLDASQIEGNSINREKIKIGIPKEFFDAANDSEISRSLEETIKTFKDLGYDVQEVSLPHAKYAIECYYIIASSETSSNLARYDGIRFGKTRENFNDENKRRIMLGTFALSAGYADKYYYKATKVRQLIKKDFENAREKGFDVFIAPVTPTLPFKIGEKFTDPLQMYLADVYTVSANLAGIPALSLPSRPSTRSIPIGFQLMGHHFSEDTLLNLGKKYQEATNWHKRRPQL